MAAIIDFFVRIYEWIISIFYAVWHWLCEFISSFIESILSPLASACPDLSSYWSSIQVIQPYTAFVNKWIALDVALVLVSSYFTFILIMITVKLIVKLFVPTVG